MRRVKKEKWLMKLYSENKLYVWFLIGIISFSGVSIGIAMGNGNKNKVKLKETDKEVAYTEVQNVNTVPEKQIITSKDTANNEKKMTSKNNKKETNEIIKDNVEVKKEEKKLEFTMPLEGDIIKNFSDDTLMYSSTLEQWVNHTGIDIYSNESTPVKAIENGTITEIKEDPRYGYTIIIDHGQGFKSIYCNLSTLDMVRMGSNVEKGQVISGVGNTALFETKDKTHLHFEITKDEILVNPLNYINKGD